MLANYSRLVKCLYSLRGVLFARHTTVEVSFISDMWEGGTHPVDIHRPKWKWIWWTDFYFAFCKYCEGHKGDAVRLPRGQI